MSGQHLSTVKEHMQNVKNSSEALHERDTNTKQNVRKDDVQDVNNADSNPEEEDHTDEPDRDQKTTKDEDDNDKDVTEQNGAKNVEHEPEQVCYVFLSLHICCM